MDTKQVTKFIKKLNAIDALGLSCLLIVAFILQFTLHELPCPLCLLQRIGILGIAFGFLLNVQFKIHPGHYTLSLIAALLTGMISVRQIFLHLLPGDPGYGLPFLGLHLYTWVFLFCFAVTIYIAIILSISPQYTNLETEEIQGKSLSFLKQLAFAAVFLLTILNIISTYLECGWKPCPDDPVKYQIQLIKPIS